MRSFESGAKGCNCYDLDTVLLPGSIIEVLGYEKNGMAKVTCEMTENVKHKGFVYQASVENACRKFSKENTKPKRTPKSLKEIRSIFKRCIDEKVPYCWGGNQFDTVPLPGAVFKSANGSNKPYELRGFDCSGLLYYISDGTLPHVAGALENCGETLLTIRKNDRISKETLKTLLANMKDTDFVVIRGHAITVYNGGFIEFYSKDRGCVFTPASEAVQRITELAEAGQKENSDVRFVRWHPGYLQQG